VQAHIAPLKNFVNSIIFGAFKAQYSGHT
jgi:hypothetical protein